MAVEAPMAKVYMVRSRSRAVGEWRVRLDDGRGKTREYVVPAGSKRDAQRLANQAVRKLATISEGSADRRATEAPLCFEIAVNGRRTRTVGLREYGRVNIFLEYARDNPDRWRASL